MHPWLSTLMAYTASKFVKTFIALDMLTSAVNLTLQSCSTNTHPHGQWWCSGYPAKRHTCETSKSESRHSTTVYFQFSSNATASKTAKTTLLYSTLNSCLPQIQENLIIIFTHLNTKCLYMWTSDNTKGNKTQPEYSIAFAFKMESNSIWTG